MATVTPVAANLDAVGVEVTLLQVHSRAKRQTGVWANMTQESLQTESTPSPTSTLGNLVTAVTAYLHRAIGGDIEDAGADAMVTVNNAASTVSWMTAEAVNAETCRRQHMALRPVRLVGHIVHRSHTELLDGVGGLVEVASLRVRDTEGNEIDTLDVVGADLLQRLDDARRHGGACEILGLPVALHAMRGRRLDRGRRTFRFHVVDVRPADDPMDLIGASAADVTRTTERFKELGAGSFLDAVLKSFVDKLGLVRIEGSPLADAIETVVLQALSTGRVMNSPGRISLMLVSPPGQEKKLPALLAKYLNPTYEQLTASRCSPAGLVGPSHRTKTGWSFEPGALAKASEGVLAMQDAHDIPRAQVRELAPILYQVMEDGEVHGGGVSGGRSYATSAALLIDANRIEDAYVAGGAEAPILGLVPLLSRMDVIIELPLDLEHAFDVGEQMIATVAQSNEAAAGEQYIRSLQLSVAHLRRRHPVINLGPVRADLTDAYREIQETRRDFMAQSPALAASISRRLVVQMGRLVAASARAGNRSTANNEDVHGAIRLIDHKLDYLEQLADRLSDCPVPNKAARMAWIATDFAGQEVETAEAWELFSGERVSERTMRRSLVGLGARRKGKGRYEVPAA